jgi:hypothetical protein
MIGLLVKLVLGVVLFAGSLVGGLAATGRLNHEGTANIPLLNSFFPAPPPPAEGEAGAHGDAAAGADGHAADAAHGKDDGHAPADAHAAPAGEGKAPAKDAAHGAAEPAGDEQEPKPNEAKPAPGPRNQKVGRSLNEPEKPAGGGGHGEAPAAEGHGEPSPAPGHGESEPKKPDHHEKPKPKTEPASPEGDFQKLQQSLQGKGQYQPGEYYRFDGMPAGLTPEQINEAWQRVQGLMADIEKRRIALELREQALEERESDISRRQAALGKERVELEQMQRQLDAKIQKFQEQVKLVRNDEAAALKRNAQTMASFEPAKAAEIIEDMWKTEKGQDEVLKLFEFMDKDAVNGILAVLPGPMTQDLLKKRLRVSKEPAATGK